MYIPTCEKHSIEKTKTRKGAFYCKICTKEYRESNKGKIKSYLDKYRSENRFKNIAYQKEYRSIHGKDLLEKKKDKYRKNNPNMKVVSKYGNLKDHPDYAIWSHMKQRCYNPNDKNYKDYGGRGIKVCDRWKNSFENFLDDMGARPSSRHSIDRYPNNDGDYEPGNVRWATSDEQNNNRRSNINYRIGISEDNLIHYPYGKLITLAEFSKLTNLPLVIVKYRYAQHPNNTEWILHDDYDNRYYEYKGYKYNLSELAILSGLKYSVISTRLRQLNWSVERAISE